VNHAQHHTASTSRLAFQATVHCLTGCGTGEVLGLAAGTAIGLSNAVTLVLGILLAYAFGYGLTLIPLLRAGMPLLRASAITFAAETLSITTMEIVDNLVVLAIPGAMDAGLAEFLFWGSLAVSLALAFVAAFPVNRWLIARGLGHAVVHGAHS
jgi:uncharacterized protein DUF4396